MRVLTKRGATAVIAGGIVATLVAGCASGDPGGGGNAAGSDGRTPISITWRDQGEGDGLRRFFEDYFVPQFEEENDDIEIVLAPIAASEADYFARIALSLQSSDTAPDVVAQDTFQIGADSAAGFLLPLDDKLAEWPDWNEHFVENLKDGVLGFDGQTYALPGTSDSRGLWFNRDVLDKAGIGRDWAPSNWQEILDAAEAVRDNVPDATPLSFNVASANGEATTMQSYLMFLHGTGEVLFDFDEEKWVIESQGILDSFGFIQQAMCTLELGPTPGVAFSANYGAVMLQERLPSGQAGIVLDGFWNGGLWREGGVAELENVQDVLGFAAFPTQDGQAPGSVTMSGGWGWSIPAHSQNHDKSWRVLQALGSAEMQARRVIIEGNLAVRSDSAQDPEYLATAFIEESTAFLENAFFRPAFEEYPVISTEIQALVEAVASCSMTPQQAMEAFGASVIRIVGEENTLRR